MTFSHLITQLKGFPTVSGLQDNDYPNLNEMTNSGINLTISQFSALTTIPLPKGLLEQFSRKIFIIN